MADIFGGALDLMHHRGPDGRGLERIDVERGELLFGHRRLAIIDLSKDGLQPMHSADGRYTITYNGEIYNYIELRTELEQLGHRFRTRTDTEVLVEAWRQWGKDCLDRLDGMFAFAIYDKTLQRLVCARDPFGIKPLYYRLNADRFAFASELPPLLKLERGRPSINLGRAHQFLCWGDYDDGDDTFFAGFQQLRPGHWLEIDLTRSGALEPTITRWWWPYIAERSDLSLADAADQLRQLFLQSVRRQLRSDVPLGTTLSGGLDSSALACAIRHLEPDFPLHTFSYVASDPRLDERRWAQIVIDRVDGRSHWIEDTAWDLKSDLDTLIASQGEPFGSTSALAAHRVMRAARESGITVTLDGQGADELLGGYQGYPAAMFRSFGERGSLLGLARFVNRWNSQPHGSWRWTLLHLGDAFVPSALRRTALKLMGYDAAPDWLNKESFEATGTPLLAQRKLPTDQEGRGRRLAERLRTALVSNRLPALLRHGDRNSMHWSIENRVPFLSPELARFVLRLPESYLVSPQAETKHVFRKAMRGIVPDAIIDRKEKIGFETPEREILCRERKWVEQCVEQAREMDIINFEPFKTSIDSILDGNARFSFRAWRMINLCRWASIYSVQ